MGSWRRIAGISARTNHEIRRAETRPGDDDVRPGDTELAWRRYRAFTLAPGRRTLYPQDAVCRAPDCAFDDVRHARDVLDEVLHRLPPHARTELGRQVAALDALFLRRTLPDPLLGPSSWYPDRWWYRRLAGGHGAT